MPAKVGAGTFWTEPIKWITGQIDEDPDARQHRQELAHVLIADERPGAPSLTVVARPGSRQ
jgi:hypothetical protein